jgi:hypothetical protein
LDIAGPTVDIYDIMACDVYCDFMNFPGPKEQHLFLVSFYPTEDVPTPDLIERIIALGPDGYAKEITNQRFTDENRDGWIYDAALNYYWYMVNVATGYLAEGDYTVEVTLRTGETLSQTRTQRGLPGAALVSAYLENREKLLSSFAGPGSWSTLADLGGPDAYYVYRLAEGAGPDEFDIQHLVWWDNIFIQRARGTDDQAGLNRGQVTARPTLRAATAYTWFVEITDANVQSETNICILQPHQTFTA